MGLTTEGFSSSGNQPSVIEEFRILQRATKSDIYFKMTVDVLSTKVEFLLSSMMMNFVTSACEG